MEPDAPAVDREGQQLCDELSQVYQHAPVGLCLLDADLRFVRINDRLAEIDGKSADEHVGRSLREVVPDLAPTLEPFYRHVLQTGEPVYDLPIEGVTSAATGSVRHWVASYLPVRSGEGRVRAVAGIVQEVTEQRRAQAALQESERGYRLLFENNPHPMWVYDLDTLRFLAVNETATERYGYSQQEFLGLTIKDIHPAEELPRLHENVARASPDPEESGLWRHRTKDGRPLEVRVTSRPIEFGGRRARLVLALDVTEAQRSEAALRDSEEKYRRLVEISPVAMWISDAFTVTFANPAALRILGARTPGQVVGRSVFDFVHPDYHAEVRERVARMVDTGASVPLIEEKLVRLDGSIVDVEVVATPFDTPRGRVRQVLFQDITERRKAAAALRQKTDELDGFFSTALDLLCIADMDGHFRRLNREWEVTLGYTIEELEGRRFLDFVHPDDRPETLRALSQLAARREVRGFVNRYRRRDGSYRWIEWRSVPVGGVVYAAARDITERRNTEEALRQANRQLRMLSTCNEALIRIEDETELLASICRIAVQVGGYRMAWVGYADDDEARSVRPIAHAGLEDGYLDLARVSWADNERGRGPVGTAIREGRVCAVQDILRDARFQPWRVEAAARGYAGVCALPLVSEGRPFGALAIYSTSADAFHAEEVGLLSELASDLAFGIGAVRAQVERRWVEAALRASEERYRIASDASGQLLYDHDVASGQIEYAGRIEAITGYEVSTFNALGFAGWQALVHPDDRADVLRSLEAAREDRGPFAARYRLARKDGAYLHLEDQGVFLYDPSGRAVRMVGSLKDETDRRSAEEEHARLENQLQQAMKMEAVGRLAGGIAHDFNNLLMAIIGNIDLARLARLSTPVRQHLDEIAKAAHSAASLTRQLLAFSRRQISEPRALVLNELVRNVEKMLTRLIGEDVVLDTVLADELDTVKVDPGQFEQVLANLVVNARDAMPSGGKLLIETSNADLDEEASASHPPLPPGRYVVLSVTDTGVGMSEEVKRRVFEPFFTTKPLGRGTGLGLATIFGTVKQAGGMIEVESEPGRGSRFAIYLPAVAERAESLTREHPGPELPRGSETVLVVEDEDSVRELTEQILRHLGYRVLSAPDGHAALQAAGQSGERIDVLLTDVVMPGMNGRELAEALVKIQPGVRPLFTSGYTEDVVVHHGVAADGLAFLGKPYSAHALAVKLRDVLDGRH
jgi:two-component system, cell cycle sensor histidine kinase and response regulator CckA